MKKSVFIAFLGAVIMGIALFAADVSAIVNCPSGSFRSGKKCYICPAGSYCINNNRYLCPKGRYQSKTGQSKCLACGSGKYATQTGSTKCSVCPKTKKYCTTGEPTGAMNATTGCVTEETFKCADNETCNKNTGKCESKCPFTVDSDGKSCLYLENFKTRSCGSGKYNLVAMGWYHYETNMTTYKDFVEKNCLSCPANATCDGKDFTCEDGYKKVKEYNKRACEATSASCAAVGMVLQNGSCVKKVCATPTESCAIKADTINNTTNCVVKKKITCSGNTPVCNQSTGKCEAPVTDCSKRPQVGDSCTDHTASCYYEGLICQNGKWTAKCNTCQQLVNGNCEYKNKNLTNACGEKCCKMSCNSKKTGCCQNRRLVTYTQQKSDLFIFKQDTAFFVDSDSDMDLEIRFASIMSLNYLSVCEKGGKCLYKANRDLKNIKRHLTLKAGKTYQISVNLASQCSSCNMTAYCGKSSTPTVEDCSKRPQVGESCVGSSCAYEGLICDNGKWAAIGNCNPGYETECSVCNAKTYNMENRPDGTSCQNGNEVCYKGECKTPQGWETPATCTEKGMIYYGAGDCVFCRTDHGTVGDYSCPASKPLCNTKLANPKCEPRGNCNPGYETECSVCNAKTYNMENKPDGTQCHADIGYCQAGQCVTCPSHAYYDVKNGTCVCTDKGAVFDKDAWVCASPANVSCSSDFDCPKNTPICDKTTGQCVAAVEPECHTDLDCSIQDSKEWQCDEEGYCKEVWLIVKQSCINNRCTFSQGCESGARLNGKCVKSDCLIPCPEKSSDELWTIARKCIDKGRADCGVQTQQCPDDQEWNKEEQRCLCKSPFPLPPDGKCLQSWDDVKEIACNRKKFNVVASGWGSLSTGNKVPWDTFYERLCHDCLENATCDGTHINCKSGFSMVDGKCVATQQPEKKSETSANATSIVTQCDDGEYLFDGKCRPCPKGAYCAGGKVQLCPEGTYNDEERATSAKSCKKCKWEVGTGSVICAPPRTKRK